MQAFETVGTIDTKGYLKLNQPLSLRNKVVKVIIMIADSDDVETDWAHELSPAQQLELETALAECENPSKLTSHEDVIKMSRQWLQE